jgi:hypothetical protein
MQIIKPLLKDVEENGGMAAYEENMSCVRAAVEQTETGIVIDQQKLKVLKKTLEDKRKWCKDILYKLGKLPEEFNLNSSQHLAWFLFKENTGMLEKLEELENAFKPVKMDLYTCEEGHKKWVQEGDVPTEKCRYCGSELYVKTDVSKTKEKARVNKRTNELTGDAKQLDLIRKITAVEPIIVGRFFGKRNRDTNSLILDKRARQSLHGSVMKEIVYIKSLKRITEGHECDLRKLKRLSLWIRFFNTYQQVNKNISTYTSYPLWKDGRIHTNILLHGTASGRPASRNPNVKMSAFVKSGELRETV